MVKEPTHAILWKEDCMMDFKPRSIVLEDLGGNNTTPQVSNLDLDPSSKTYKQSTSIGNFNVVGEFLRNWISSLVMVNQTEIMENEEEDPSTYKEAM